MSNTVKIIAIVEDTTKIPDISAEHGVSLLIQADNKRILFDTGASSLFINNSKKLGVNLSAIDFVCLSHGHYDHAGGLEHINNKQIYIHPDLFISKYKKIGSHYKYVGVQHNRKFYEQKNNLQFIEVTKSLHITENIMLHVDFKKPESSEFYIKARDDYKPDLFNDELALSINTPSGLVIISGCSHSGIMNILDKVIIDQKISKIHALLGGLHLAKFSLEENKKIAEKLNQYQIDKIGISHCTGNKLAEHLTDVELFDLNTGDYCIC